MTYNKITVCGYAGGSPTKKTVGETVLVTFSLATHMKRKGVKISMWHRIVFFNPPDFLMDIQKGDLVLVDGTLQMEFYKSKEGEDKLRVEIVGNQFVLTKSTQDD